MRTLLGAVALALLVASQPLFASGLSPLPAGATGDHTIILGASAALPDCSAAGALVVPPTAVSVNSLPTAVPAVGGLSVAHGGYNGSTIDLTYALPPNHGGVYKIWTAFTLGGVAEQAFRLSVGETAGSVFERAAWTQSNDISWKLDWRTTTGSVMLLPSDRSLVIDESGNASGHKELVAIALVKLGDLPLGMDDAGSRVRATMIDWRPEKPSRRLYLLESASATDADPLLAAIVRNAETLAKTTVASIFTGDEAVALGRQSGATGLPALVVMDDSYGIRAIARPTDAPASINSALLASAPLAAADVPSSRPPASFALASGAPTAWLLAGLWAGPAGLSLWGLDAESEAMPSDGDRCIALQFDTVVDTEWRRVESARDGSVTIDPSTGDFAWSRGTAYVCVYLEAASSRIVTLHLSQTGVATAGWLDTVPLVFAPEQAGVAATSNEAPIVSRTDQGTTIVVMSAQSRGLVAANVKLHVGWNRLLVKLIMQNRAGEAFAFRAWMTKPGGAPASDIESATTDPEQTTDFHPEAMRVQPIVSTDAPFNLVGRGKPLALYVSLKRLASAREEQPIVPLRSFHALVDLSVRDYDGKPVVSRSCTVTFPGDVRLPIASALPTGYYSVHLRLRSASGATIAVYPPDGFSVIGGTGAMRTRASTKKMASTYYWMDDGTYATRYFPYMERLGLFRNIGGNPGANAVLYSEANRRGIALAGDLWNFDDPKQVADNVAAVARYVDSFKSYNEVDIVPAVRGTPEHWLSVSKAHFDAVRAGAPHAVVLSASLVRPGAGSWFKDCLALGLDKTVDVWDVHCYPKEPPTLGGTMSNSSDETELGVLKAYAELGRVNDKPFWIGETGARACHGPDARRWQAEMVAKMVACANSRPDFQKIGFLIPWGYSREKSSLGDIEAGHMPAEAAYYTAGALIDGFAYKRLAVGGDTVQAGQFGPTTMLWSTTPTGVAHLQLDPSHRWVTVDVVGRVAKLPVSAKGGATITATPSPIYILAEPDYKSLTAY